MNRGQHPNSRSNLRPNRNGRPKRDFSITNAMQLAKDKVLSVDDGGQDLTVAHLMAQWLAYCAAMGIDKRNTDQGVKETTLPFRDRLDAIKTYLAQCEGFKVDLDATDTTDDEERDVRERMAALSEAQLNVLKEIGINP